MALKKSSKKFIVTEESKNTYGFKVKTSGIQTEDFLKNPVGLLNHDYDKVICLWGDINTSGTIMTDIPSFDENDDEAVKISQKVEDDIIKGASIGITALAWDGDTITECILNEISITPLPANKNAVVLYDTEGKKLSADQAKQFLLSLSSPNNDHKKTEMNENTKKALIALAVHLGVTLTLNDSEDKFEEIATKAASKIQELKNSVTAVTDARAIKLVDDAIEAKKITASDKDTFLALAKTNFELAEKTLGAIPSVDLNINNQLAPDADKDKDKDKGGDERKDWTFSDWSKKDSAGLGKMQLNDKARFADLYKKEYGEDYTA